MTNEMQIGCKKCGAVIAIEARVSSTSCEYRLKDATFQAKRDVVQIICKKCKKAVYAIGVDEA